MQLACCVNECIGKIHDGTGEGARISSIVNYQCKTLLLLRLTRLIFPVFQERELCGKNSTPT